MMKTFIEILDEEMSKLEAAVSSLAGNVKAHNLSATRLVRSLPLNDMPRGRELYDTWRHEEALRILQGEKV